MASEHHADADLDPGREPSVHLPLLEAETGAPATEAKPSWRGWVHAGTLPVSIAAGIVLIVLAEGTTAKLACALYAICSWLLFGISALYHRFNWSEKTRVALKRFDHANIFLLISGTYAPIALVALPPEKGWPLFAIVWGAALLGICFRVFWIGAPRWLYVALYIALGWAAVAYLGDIAAVNVATVVLIVVGGLFYTAGAVFYALKRPNFWPGHFGFHELFHVFTVLAFLSQWTGILLLCIDPPVFA
ncbi:MAG: PAQR family membrane homeostasis protein TrhA [Pseudoclavibacter sp.]